MSTTSSTEQTYKGFLCSRDDLLRAVAGGVSDGVIFIGHDGRIMGVNTAAEEIFGHPEADVIGRDASFLIPVDVSRWAEETGAGPNLLRRDDFIRGQEFTGQRKDGASFIMIVNLTSTEVDGETVFVAVVRDVTDWKRVEAKIQELTLHDGLTGLANRNLFQLKLQDAFEHAEKRGQSVALMLVDLDGFKSVNDSFGHAVGDSLLKEVAGRLGGVMRRADTVARLNGDEFGVIVGGLDREEVVHGLAQRIIESLSQPMTVDGCLVQCGASIGISFFPADETHADKLIRKADLALDAAKVAGRRTYHVYREETAQQARTARELEVDLRLAVVRDELLLDFQPILDIDGQRLNGAEALVRWRHPARGIIPPGDFIPIAESSDVMVPIGEWVLRTACRQNRDWQAAGLPPFRVAVNISARQFQDGDFVSLIRHTLRETGLDSRWLELEITEGMVMDDTEQMIRKFHEISELGVEISIDDFGTGYSSLAYLKRFPVQRLKIDRSFVQDVTTDPDDAAITEAVIRMGHSLNLKIVAEGVESEDQASYLRHKQCDELQGFLFSRPLPPEKFADWLGCRLRSEAV